MSIKDFFVSYTAVDRAWAEWIAWQLEAAGYSTVVQAWDFSPGSNWVHEMDRAAATATRTIAVLSPAYLNSVYGEVEWQSALRKDPTGEQRLLIPIRVAVVDVPGLLASRVYVDFVERDTEAARQALLAAIQQQRAKPSREPSFPGVQPGLPGKAPAFPGTTTTPKISNPSGIQSDQVEETKDEQDDSHIASGSRSITNEPNSQSALDPRSAPGIHVEFQTDLDHDGRVADFAFSPKSNRLVAATGKNITVWDLEKEKLIHTLRGKRSGAPVHAISCRWDGLWVAAASYGHVQLWNIESGRRASDIMSSTGSNVIDVAFSSDGNLIAAAHIGKVARVWNFYNNRMIVKVKHEDRVGTAAFSHDNRYLATGSHDRTARIWHIPSGHQKLRILHTLKVNVVAFSPTGKTLATACADGIARIWDVTAGKELQRFEHRAEVSCLAFSPNGSWLATGSTDKTARVWNLELGEEVTSIRHDQAVHQIAFDFTGYKLATAADKVVKVWAFSHNK